MQRSCNRCGTSFAPRDGRWKLCDPCSEARKTQQPAAVVEECQQCGADISGRHYQARFCFACTAKRARNCTRGYQPHNDNEAARKLTNYAVKLGILPHPSEFDCTDCKRRQAQCYDHRDYNLPLDVEPVCMPCNSSRGKGIPLHLEISHKAGSAA